MGAVRHASGARRSTPVKVGCGVAVAAAAGVAALVFAAPGFAQEPQRGDTVTDRARPDYDPRGIRTGGFLLFPEMGVSQRYNDNIFADESDTRDDFITVVSPGALLRSDWNRHALQFTAGLDAGFYATNSREDYLHYDIGTQGRIDVLRDTNVRGGVNYARNTVARSSPDDVRGLEPTEYTSLTPTLGFFQRWNRVSLDMEGGANVLDYRSVPTPTGIISNDGQDRTEYDLTTRLGYEIVPEYEAFLRLRLRRVRYDQATDSAGFNRDSEGYEVVAGTRIDLTGVLFGDVFAGYRSQDYEDPRLKTARGVSFGGALTWNVTPLTTIRGSITRVVEETIQLGASGYFATVYAASVDHELLRNLLVGATLAFENNDFQGIARDDDIYRAGVYGRYLMTRNLYLSAHYDHDRRDSNVAGADFTRNVFMLRLQTQL